MSFAEFYFFSISARKQQQKICRKSFFEKSTITLNFVYENVQCIRQDYTKARKLCKNAVTHGEFQMQNNLGILCLVTQGCIFIA